MMKGLETGKFQLGAACNAINVSLLSRDSVEATLIKETSGRF